MSEKGIRLNQLYTLKEAVESHNDSILLSLYKLRGNIVFRLKHILRDGVVLQPEGESGVQGMRCAPTYKELHEYFTLQSVASSLDGEENISKDTAGKRRRHSLRGVNVRHRVRKQGRPGVVYVIKEYEKPKS